MGFLVIFLEGIVCALQAVKPCTAQTNTRAGWGYIGGAWLGLREQTLNALPLCAVSFPSFFGLRATAASGGVKGAKKLGRHLALYKQSAGQSLSANPDRTKKGGRRRHGQSR